MGLVISKPVISPLLVAFVQALALQRAAWQAVALPARRWHSQAPTVPGEGRPHRGSIPHLSLLGRAGHAAATSPPLLPHTSTAQQLCPTRARSISTLLLKSDCLGPTRARHAADISCGLCFVLRLKVRLHLSLSLPLLLRRQLLCAPAALLQVFIFGSTC